MLLEKSANLLVAFSQDRSSEGLSVTVNSVNFWSMFSTRTFKFVLHESLFMNYTKVASPLKANHSSRKVEVVRRFLQNTFSYKFFKFHRKTPVLESLFKKILQLKCFPVEFAESLRTFFYSAPPVAVFCRRFLSNVDNKWS